MIKKLIKSTKKVWAHLFVGFSTVNLFFHAVACMFVCVFTAHKCFLDSSH